MSLTPIKCYDVTNYIFAGGAVADGSTDDSAAIQAAVDAIATDYSNSWIDQQGNPEIGVDVRTGPVLYFPPGIYRIGTTISFDDDILNVLTIKGDNAILRSLSLDLLAFNMPQSYKIHLSGISFLNFDMAVRFDNEQGLDTNQVVIESCAFQGCKEALYIETHTSVIKECKFHYNSQCLEAYGEKITIKDCWFTARDMKATGYPAQIKNYGFMHFETNVLVPPSLPNISTQAAWINNYGCITVDDIRLGAEENSFTLINNFAGVSSISSDIYEPRSVIVRNSVCSTNYTDPTYGYQPAIVRYVTKIPNLTLIEGNLCHYNGKLVEFANGTVPSSIILASGDVSTENVCVDIYNNVGGNLYPHGSHIPIELYPFVRNKSSQWPSRPSLSLEQLEPPVLDAVSGAITYKFEYPGSYASNVLSLERTQFMINYTGNPSPGGFTGYGGLFIGYLKAIGFYDGIDKSYHLHMETAVNQVSNPSASYPVPGPYTVSVFWDESTTADLPAVNVSNRVFYIRITGTNGTTADYDRISVLPLYAL